MTKRNRLIHTPEGVRDIYGEECRRKLAVQEKILHTLYLYGCEHIQTPSFEYADIFNEDRGSVASEEMFRFFDRDNHMLVLRPDMTPAVARCAAKYFMDDELPLRFCYLERTFTNNTSFRGRLKERAESGAELLGDDSPDADAEVIAMAVDCLKAAGLKEFQVELGQAAFYRSLAEEAGLEEEDREELDRLIENKNRFGTEAFLKTHSIREDLKEALLKTTETFGDIEKIRRAKVLTANEKALKAIERLERVHTLLEEYKVADCVSYDLGMVSRFQYYTGIIFKAYTYGTGDYIVTGGRYDRLLMQFGKDTPAVGFAIVVDQLMAALLRQKIDVPLTAGATMSLYEPEARENAVCLSRLFRSQDRPVQPVSRAPGKTFEDYKDMARKRRLRNILYLKDNRSFVTAFDTLTGNVDEILLSACQ